MKLASRSVRGISALYICKIFNKSFLIARQGDKINENCFVDIRQCENKFNFGGSSLEFVKFKRQSVDFLEYLSGNIKR